MFRLCAALPFVVWSAAAQALSCLPHDVAATFNEANASENRFVVVIGQLDFAAELLPKTDLNNQQGTPEETRIPATLTGKTLARGEFSQDYGQSIVLNAQCFGPWCASAVPGQEVLAFVNIDRDPAEVTITPCGGNAFAKPTEEMRARVLACTRGDCTPRLDR